jgi:hypothetical protein
VAARALLGDRGGGWGAPGGGCGEIINMFIVGIEKMRLLYLICLTITALPLLCQHNPILPFKDYGDLLEPLEEGLVQNKANEVTSLKGWEIKIVTHTKAIPQVEQNLQDWIAQGSNTVVFYVLAQHSGGMPVIAVTSDLESALPQPVRQHIAQEIMLPWYIVTDYSTCLQEGIEALLSDQLVLASVAFEGSYPIDGVEEPQWQLSASSEAGNGIIAGAVCYKRQDVMELRPTFSFTGALPGSSIKIKATANDATYTVDGAVYNESTIQPSGPGIEISTGESVDYWADFEVEWSLSFDGGGSWVEVGATTNDIYLTLDIPAPPYISSRELDERLLYYSCNKGKGKDNKVDLFLSIWKSFDLSTGGLTPNDFLNNGDYRGLSYYGTPNPETWWKSLINSRDGQCTSWTSLLTEAMIHQGYESGVDFNRVRVDPVNGAFEGLLIKNWHFPSAPNADYRIRDTIVYQYMNLMPYDQANPSSELQPEFDNQGQPTGKYLWVDKYVYDLPGIPAQGNLNPISNFSNFHQLVKINFQGEGLREFYDPSYGITYATELELRASVDGLFVVDVFEPITVTVNGQERTAVTVYFRNDIDENDI